VCTAPRYPPCEEIFLAAIAAGKSHNEARRLARLSERQADHLIDTEDFAQQLEAARAVNPGIQRLDLITALEERDAREAAVEYAGGDFDEYWRMCEDGRMEEINLLVGAARMRAAGRWHSVPASLRLEIHENALEWYVNTAQ
jgi:hypothetical protein